MVTIEKTYRKIWTLIFAGMLFGEYLKKNEFLIKSE
jgi:hypothetical protein